MSLFERLFPKPKFHQYEDNFTLSREGLWHALRKSISKQMEDNHVVILVVHFEATFETLQDKLSSWDIDYAVETKQITGRWFEGLDKDTGNLRLVLAELLMAESETQFKLEKQIQASVMVCERHFLPERDRHIVSFCKYAPCRIKLGYFLSFEDTVLKFAIGPQTIELLVQMGLNDLELISSRMVGRKLDSSLKRLTKTVTSEVRVASADDWLEANLGS